jgi:hypothetical protein
MKTLEPRSSFACVLLVAMLTATRAQAEEPTRASANDRGLEWFWANAEAGVETANLTTFNTNLDTLTAGLTPTSGVGPAVGVGAGVRLLFITIGPRGRLGNMHGDAGDWQLWTLDAEVGVRVPLRRFEPYFTLAGGYATIGSFRTAVSGLGSGFDISGGNLRAGVGLDVYVTRIFSINAALTGEALILARQGVSLRDLAEAKRLGTIDDARARVLEVSGSSVGAALTFTVGVGVHF